MRICVYFVTLCFMRSSVWGQKPINLLKKPQRYFGKHISHQFLKKSKSFHFCFFPIICFADDVNVPRRNEEVGEQGFLKSGACIGITGRKDLEYWPTTIVTFVPCIVLSLERVSWFDQGGLKTCFFPIFIYLTSCYCELFAIWCRK